MAWTFEQSSGDLVAPDGEVLARGYSGFGIGKNNPTQEAVPNVGPIPRGGYTIGLPTCLDGGPHGAYVLPLTPDATNVMHGRSQFLIHGDSLSHAGCASHGCIILVRPIREFIALSHDRRLEVTP